ncbi:hypothetical protein ALT785_110088 [Alteromonas infernus]
MFYFSLNYFCFMQINYASNIVFSIRKFVSLRNRTTVANCYSLFSIGEGLLISDTTITPI